MLTKTSLLVVVLLTNLCACGSPNGAQATDDMVNKAESALSNIDASLATKQEVLYTATELNTSIDQLDVALSKQYIALVELESSIEDDSLLYEQRALASKAEQLQLMIADSKDK